MLKSEQIGTLITALGTGIGRNDFNIDKLRYHKVVIMTDADVDGEHIRTLLLTFFYRQMPEIIERGYLYIAQPPLYAIKRGKKLKYLLDDAALDLELLSAGSEGCFLRLSDGSKIEGDELLSHLKMFSKAAGWVNGIDSEVGNKSISSLLSVTGAIHPAVFESEENRQNTVNYLLPLLRAQTNNSRWAGEATGDGLEFSYTQRGIKHTVRVTDAVSSKSVTNSLLEISDVLQKVFLAAPVLVTPKEEIPVFGPIDLCDAVRSRGGKDSGISRYKGLGEMNPDQLWETTLDPEHRVLLKVRMDHHDDADLTIGTVMGDAVEPRKEYILRHASEVSNIDI